MKPNQERVGSKTHMRNYTFKKTKRDEDRQECRQICTKILEFSAGHMTSYYLSMKKEATCSERIKSIKYF